MADLAEREAKLEALLAANGPLPNEHYHALADWDRLLKELGGG